MDDDLDCRTSVCLVKRDEDDAFRVFLRVTRGDFALDDMRVMAKDDGFLYGRQSITGLICWTVMARDTIRTNRAFGFRTLLFIVRFYDF